MTLELYSTDALVHELANRHQHICVVGIADLDRPEDFTVFNHGSLVINAGLLELAKHYVVSRISEAMGGMTTVDPDVYGPDIDEQETDERN